jgi:photoactive yellow protein
MIETICAWCTRNLRPGDPTPSGGPVSHGLCATCAGASGVFLVEDLYDLTEDVLDALPLGTIRIDPSGRVRAYNRAEQKISGRHRDDVIGRNFFTEVAPCTAVAEVQGRFDDMVRTGQPGRAELDFIFRFSGGDRFVALVILYDPGVREGILLVRVHR